MKNKGVYESHELTKEHRYLGEAKSHLEKGHVPGGKIDRRTLGTSKLLHDDAGVIPKGQDTKY